jgi:spoIIIJ-associated protein
MEKEIKNLLAELFQLIGIEVKTEIVEEKQTEETIYKVELDPGESAGLLIGAHGLTMSAIQSFVAIAIKQKTGEWIKLSLDIAGWSEKQNERLTDLAHQTAERVKQTGEDQMLYNLNPVQRRMVHMALSDDKEIQTESAGEGQDRYLIVKKAS